MSKAVLIMDMPECCYDCPITVCDADNMSTERRSENCALRELPERKKAMGIPERPTMRDFERKGYQAGWNACLDAITGEEQE